ncbi:unnamed protein product [Pieris macdunnoughi]|uniref:Uncharacterized protein n=1 Tax=Pieris macdunnoughi TaxID=345717 RepID=A0A821KWF9_9NEOP|nr:unnamed protein product [Pieris macdunnoughi]
MFLTLDYLNIVPKRDKQKYVVSENLLLKNQIVSHVRESTARDLKPNVRSALLKIGPETQNHARARESSAVHSQRFAENRARNSRARASESSAVHSQRLAENRVRNSQCVYGNLAPYIRSASLITGPESQSTRKGI